MTDPSCTRRSLLKNAACGFGYLAWAGLASEQAALANGFRNPLLPKKPHFEAKAKRVILMFMQGGPSQHDTFEYNPELDKAAGREVGSELNGVQTSGKILPAQFKFQRHGQSGIYISEIFPELAKHADDLCLLNGMHTDTPAHPQATVFAHTGSITFVRPSIGAWALYGLGTENQDLPGFVTINPPVFGGAQLYGSAFMPATYQGTRINIKEDQDPIENIRNARISTREQREQIDFIQSMNRNMLERAEVDRQLEGIIQSYELAFRMQNAVPQVMDISRESEKTRQMYGLDDDATKDYGTQCLLARRMAEAGVRFIEIGHRGWDQHAKIRERLQRNATAVDRPIAALITDLKQRGLLDETLLVWGGEFGRSSYEQNDKSDGRRHNHRGYTMWMAGGGVKGGLQHGACDVTGAAVEGRVHLHDLHATILHQLGLDHTKLTYRYAGRDFRLTDVHGKVATDILT